MVAVCTFMGTGAVAAYLSRQTDLSRFAVASATAAAVAPVAPVTVESFLLHVAPTVSTLVAVATVFNKNFAPNTWLFGQKDKDKDAAAKAHSAPLAEHLVTFGCAFTMGTPWPAWTNRIRAL